VVERVDLDQLVWSLVGKRSQQDGRRTLKIAVFAPMPRANVITNEAAKPGRRNTPRTTRRRSVQNSHMEGLLFVSNWYRALSAWVEATRSVLP
jgi:hypothetical protein